MKQPVSHRVDRHIVKALRSAADFRRKSVTDLVIAGMLQQIEAARADGLRIKPVAPPSDGRWRR